MSTPNPFVIDNFNRANSTTLGTSSSGVAWAAQQTRVNIDSNTWFVTGGSGAAVIPKPNAGATVAEATVWQSQGPTDGNPNAQLMLKSNAVADTVNAYRLVLGFSAIGVNNIALQVHDGTAVTTLAASDAYSLDTNQVTLRLQKEGDVLAAWVNGDKLFEVVDTVWSTSQLTHLGASTNGASSVPGSWIRLDNFTTYDSPFADAPEPAPFTPRRQRMASLGGF